jgi:Insect cuticle protein
VYATSRTARDFRQMPEVALRHSQADYPYYNIIAPYGTYFLTQVKERFNLKINSHAGPGTYAFGYEVNDPATGNIQFRDEEKLSNGSVVGSYGYLTPENTLHVTKYIADVNGYR